MTSVTKHPAKAPQHTGKKTHDSQSLLGGSEQTFSSPVTTVSNTRLSSDVADFLKEHREFLKRTKDVDLGNF